MAYSEHFATFEQDGFTIEAYWEHDQDATPYHMIEDQGPEYAEENQKRIDAWERDEWTYQGVWVEVWKCGVKLAQSRGLWGIESDSDKSYFLEVARDEAGEAIEDAKEKLQELRAL